MQTISIDVRLAFSSGIGTYIRNVIPRIISQSPRIHFCLLGDTTKLSKIKWSQEDNVSLINCDSPIYSIREQFDLIRRIPRFTSLFWSPHYNIPLLYHGKLLVTVHDAFPLIAFSDLRQIHKKLYAKTMFRAVKRKAKAVICVSDFTRNELRQLIGDQNYHSIHNGVDPSWFNIETNCTPHPRPFLLFVGNVKPHKNLKNLLITFKMIMNEIPLDLVIVGQKEGFISGDDVAIKQADTLNDRIHFTGFIDDTLLKQYFRHAKALIFPSLYEGFGLPPLEAMACGCPTLVSDAASLPEICGDAALYCKPNDPANIAKNIITIFENAQLRSELILRGKKRAEIFTWEKCASSTLTIMNDLLKL